ncbi:hypothetical protein [Sphingomonas sp. 2378]|uniref:hypothetical protein n=1 Tax=Sphingomonas sp. 2378 TaxID=1219748 RepID=UPI00311AD4AE
MTFVAAREAHQLTKAFTAKLSGKRRGDDRTVRRDSYDVDDRRANVWRPIGDGTVAGAMDWRDSLLQTAREYDDHHRGDRGVRPLGWTAIRILEILLGVRGVPICFKTGRLEPAIDTMARIARFSRTTVIRALARLKEHNFLRWVRRSQKTDRKGEFAPQRVQVTNAYFFDIAALPRNVRQRFRYLLNRRQQRRAADAARMQSPPPSPPPPPQAPSTPALRDALARLGARVESASTPNGQYPAQGVR